MKLDRVEGNARPADDGEGISDDAWDALLIGMVLGFMLCLFLRLPF